MFVKPIAAGPLKLPMTMPVLSTTCDSLPSPARAGAAASAAATAARDRSQRRLGSITGLVARRRVRRQALHPAVDDGLQGAGEDRVLALHGADAAHEAGPQGLLLVLQRLDAEAVGADVVQFGVH